MVSPGSPTRLTELLTVNGDELIYLADASRLTLATVYPKRDVLPATVKGLNLMLTELNAALNHGPALNIRLEPVDSRGGYFVPCKYPTPDYQGGCPIGDGQPPPAPADAGLLPSIPGGTAAGRPGSPEERDTVRRLLGPDMGVPPIEVPDLAVLMLTPLLRGTLVTTS